LGRFREPPACRAVGLAKAGPFAVGLFPPFPVDFTFR
jgi:hypothetical protein